jgi:hypothetical protein
MKFAAPFLAAALLTASAALADLAAPFTAPPYKLDASIIGLEGWEMRAPNAVDDGSTARLVAVRWDDFRPAVRLEGASIKNSFPPTTGSKVRITAQMAFTYPSTGPDLPQTRIITNAPFGEIVFKYSGDGGLGISDGTRTNFKVLVPLSDLKPNCYYTFSVLVDYDSSTYAVSISGEKADGSPLAFEEKGVSFESKTKVLKGVAIITSRFARAYLRQLLIESL